MKCIHQEAYSPGGYCSHIVVGDPNKNDTPIYNTLVGDILTCQLRVASCQLRVASCQLIFVS